jgi:hypothetical protein
MDCKFMEKDWYENIIWWQVFWKYESYSYLSIWQGVGDIIWLIANISVIYVIFFFVYSLYVLGSKSFNLWHKDLVH